VLFKATLICESKTSVSSLSESNLMGPDINFIYKVEMSIASGPGERAKSSLVRSLNPSCTHKWLAYECKLPTNVNVQKQVCRCQR
jgi:hypothetical protein